MEKLLQIPHPIAVAPPKLLFVCVALAFASVGSAMAFWRRRPVEPEVFESLLRRVSELRAHGFAGRSRHACVKSRARLVSTARTRLKEEKEYFRRQERKP